MNGISVFISLIFLLILAFLSLLKAKTLLGVFFTFLLLNFIAYMTLYLFNPDT
jgi:hypothetical protein